MDPNKNLEQQIFLARRLAYGGHCLSDNESDAMALADLVICMHEWLTSGGFLPAAWAFGRAESKEVPHE